MDINKVYLGDCLEIMPDIPDKSVDMILCDLPYGTTACKWDTVILFEPLWKEYKRLIKDNGAIVLTASQPFTSALVMSNINDFSHQWIWDKGMAANPLLSKQMPLKTFEDIVVFYQQYDDTFSDVRRLYFKKVLNYIGKSKKQVIDKLGQGFDHCFRYGSRQFDVPTRENYQILIDVYKINELDGFLSYNQISNTQRTYNPQMITRGNPVKKGYKGKLKDDCFLGAIEIDTRSFNNIYYPTSIINIPQGKGKLHPTQKPVALFEYLIKTYTNTGDLVLDNCAGSGTTGVACKNLNRNYILIEKELEYYEIIQKRLE